MGSRKCASQTDDKWEQCIMGSRKCTESNQGWGTTALWVAGSTQGQTKNKGDHCIMGSRNCAKSTEGRETWVLLPHVDSVPGSESRDPVRPVILFTTLFTFQHDAAAVVILTVSQI